MATVLAAVVAPDIAFAGVTSAGEPAPPAAVAATPRAGIPAADAPTAAAATPPAAEATEATEAEAPAAAAPPSATPSGSAAAAARTTKARTAGTPQLEARALDPAASETATPAPPDAAAPAVKPVKRPRDRTWGAIEVLGAHIGPGRRRDLYWTAGQSFAGSAIETPIVVIRGRKPGPTLCLTAAIHGDELNGVEIVRRVLASVDERELAGTIIGAPIVNLLGFSRGSRYLPDRRDLNRYFPGRAEGSLASRIAHAFFNDVVRHCERLVDFHTGSFKRTNLPQLRANLKNEQVREFVERFGATAVLHKAGGRGTLRYAANAAGIPTVTFELGEPGTLQVDHVSFGVRALDTLLDKLGMVERFSLWSEPQPVFYRSRWLRAYRGGILISNVRIGARVSVGDVLGIVTNPLTSEESTILSPHNGRLLGRALDQFVLPGFATFHIGIETREVAEAAIEPPAVDDEYGDDELPQDEPLDDGVDAPFPDDNIEGILDEEIH